MELDDSLKFSLWVYNPDPPSQMNHISDRSLASSLVSAYNLIQHPGAVSLMLREEHPIISFKLDRSHLCSLH